MKNLSKSEGEIKTFRQIKSRRLHHQQICTVRNVKVISSGRRKVIPDGNLNFQKNEEHWQR